MIAGVGELLHSSAVSTAQGFETEGIEAVFSVPVHQLTYHASEATLIANHECRTNPKATES